MPDPDIVELKRFWDKLVDLQNSAIFQSISAVTEGGIIRRLFEMALGSGLGCDIDLSELRERMPGGSAEAALFGEMIGAMIVEVAETDADTVENQFNGIRLGRIIEKEELKIKGIELEITLPMNDIITAWEKPFQEVAL